MGFTVLAGEGIRQGKHDGHDIIFGQITLKAEKGWFKKYNYTVADIIEIEEIDADAYRSGLATAGWGLVGIAVAGPFGAVIGGWFGGKKDNVVAAVKFSDERKFLGQFTRRKYRKLTAEYNKRKVKDQFDAA
jgi:hypothetical protein